MLMTPNVGVHRNEVLRAGETGREGIHRGDEAGVAGGRRLIDGHDVDLRAVDAKLVGAAEAVQVHVADAVAGADDGFGIDGIRETDARSPVAVIGVDQGAVVEAAALSGEDGVGGGVEVAEDVVAFPARRGVLPAQA